MQSASREPATRRSEVSTIRGTSFTRPILPSSMHRSASPAGRRCIAPADGKEVRTAEEHRVMSKSSRTPRMNRCGRNSAGAYQVSLMPKQADPDEDGPILRE